MNLQPKFEYYMNIQPKFEYYMNIQPKFEYRMNIPKYKYWIILQPKHKYKMNIQPKREKWKTTYELWIYTYMCIFMVIKLTSYLYHIYIINILTQESSPTL